MSAVAAFAAGFLAWAWAWTDRVDPETKTIQPTVRTNVATSVAVGQRSEIRGLIMDKQSIQ
jgi:hypothetical protein